MKQGMFLVVSLVAGLCFGQQSGSSPQKFFEVDRSKLPPALQRIPLEHLSSGALMLLNDNGNLVRPPAAWSSRVSGQAAAATEGSDGVALDPRVGSNIRLGDDPPALPSNMRAQAEPHIARSPVAPDFLVATSQEGRFANGGAVNCGYSVTTDGGLTWSRALIPNLTQSSGGPYFRATDPVAGFDLNGNIYLNTLVAVDPTFDTAAVVVSRSIDGGQTFGAPSVAYQQPNSNVFPDKNWMAINTFANTATAGRILVTFTLFTNVNNEGGQIARAYSDNGGAIWSAADAISARTNTQGSQPVYLPNGNVVVVFWNFGGQMNPADRLEAVISTNGGRTYGDVKFITNVAIYGPPNIRSGAFLPSVATDRTVGNLYVVYQAIFGGNPRILFSRSTDGGNNWSAPVSISNNPANSAVFNPAIAASADGQTLAAVFYDARDNPGSTTLVDLYMAQSFNGGTTWQPNIRLTSVSTDASLAPLTTNGYMLGDYQAVADPTNANVPAVPVWIDTRTGNPDPFIARVGISPQLTFTSWQAARLSLSQINNSLLGGVTGNADFDSKANLLEYALGTPPLVPDPDNINISSVNPMFTISYPKLTAATDVSLHAFRSTNLSSNMWTTLGVTETLLSDDGTTQIWQASTPANSSPIFLRLQATQP